ncbi:hypothetical protein ASG45_08160 [Microbacterium sp. Leaf436]|nr:hypothetical protein ASG45_08160 [Microbacterium sp. Leaf436]
MEPPFDLEVLVIGEALIDIVDTGTEVTEHVGGSPANVALGLGRLGVSVGLLTHLADDARGRKIVGHLTASGVHTLPESYSARATSTAIAKIASDGHADYEFDLAWEAAAGPLLDSPPRIVHTGSVAAFMEPGATAVREFLRRSSAQEITFDPNIRPALVGSHATALAVFEAVARIATVVKMSDEDAAWLYPATSADEVLRSVLQLGPRLVAITLGAEGALVANADNVAHIPAVKVDAVDTIGAGDTFMASLILDVLTFGSQGLDDESLERFGRNAVQSAAMTVSRKGADLPWLDDLPGRR